MVLTAWDIGKHTGEKLLNVIRHRRMEPLCYLPVIVVTAHATLRVVDQAFSAGCTSLLVKPISPQSLLRRVDWITNDHREFVEEGNSLAISGVKEVLESRVRKRKLSTVIASNSAVDALLNGDIDAVLDDYEDMAALNASPAKSPAQEERPTQVTPEGKPEHKPGAQDDPAFNKEDAPEETSSQPYWYGWDIGGKDDD
jgi:response regulator RpfG family c-di-GMP phosphodiesterase